MFQIMAWSDIEVTSHYLEQRWPSLLTQICVFRPHLTHWGRVTHICVNKLTIIGSDNSLVPTRRQAIIWTNGGILLIRNPGTNFSEILSEIYAFSFKTIHLKMSSGIWRLFCLGLNLLSQVQCDYWYSRENGIGVIATLTKITEAWISNLEYD